MGENKVSTYTPLSKLKKIERLNLNKSSDLYDTSFLSPLLTLKYLDLSNNSITDITPLRTLDNLLAIDIRKNHIIDYSTLTYLKTNKKLVEIYSDEVNSYRRNNQSYFGAYRNNGYIMIMNTRNHRYRSYNRHRSYGSYRYGRPGSRSHRYGGTTGVRGRGNSFRGRSYNGGGK